MKRDSVERSGPIFKRAEDFHGHLGPFLVIGIRMGLIGLDRLGRKKGDPLGVTASLPLRTPFSCVIDGLQMATRCTIGNQKLSLKNSSRIKVEFEQNEKRQRILVALNQSVFEELKSRLLSHKKLKDEEVRELAWKVAAIPEEKLFAVT